MNTQAQGDIRISAIDLGRRFGSRSVFEGVDFTCRSGESVCIIGPNGSGKSTLLRIIACLLTPTSGRIELAVNGTSVDPALRRTLLALIAPDINFYAELTGEENLLVTGRIAGLRFSKDEVSRALCAAGLENRGSDLLRTYSSGMKQRLKYASVILSKPSIMLLDEPSANLDESGREYVYGVMDRQLLDGGLLIFATNEQDEARYGGTQIRLGE